MMKRGRLLLRVETEEIVWELFDEEEEQKTQKLANASNMTLSHYIIRLLEFAEHEQIQIITKFEMKPNKEE